MTTPAERAATLERILRAILPVLADPGAPPEAIAHARSTWQKVTELIDNLHGTRPEKAPRSQNGRSPEEARPQAARPRAREDPAAEIARLQRNAEREAAGFHKLRKGRHQCEATTRDGERCQAPAIPGGSVCERHGGAAPQVRVRAALFLLHEARSEAADTLTAMLGTPGELQAVVAWSKADNAVKRAEAKVDRIRELRAELKRLKGQRGDPGKPA
jgi:hypothetical protein